MLSKKSRLYECIYNRLTAAIFINYPFLEFCSISFLSDCFARDWIPLLFKVQGRLLVLVNRDEPALFDRMEIAVFAGAKTITHLSFLSLVYFIYFLSFFFYLCIFLYTDSLHCFLASFSISYSFVRLFSLFLWLPGYTVLSPLTRNEILGISRALRLTFTRVDREWVISVSFPCILFSF